MTSRSINWSREWCLPRVGKPQEQLPLVNAHISREGLLPPPTPALEIQCPFLASSHTYTPTVTIIENNEDKSFSQKRRPTLLTGIYFLIFHCVCVYMWICAPECSCLQRPEDGVKTLELVWVTWHRCWKLNSDDPLGSCLHLWPWSLVSTEVFLVVWCLR